MSQLDISAIRRIAELSQIEIKESDIPALKEKLEATLDILNTLQSVDTNGIEPMSDPFDRWQKCREDIVIETNHRDEYQSIAPSVEDGLYLVPKVIE